MFLLFQSHLPSQAATHLVNIIKWYNRMSLNILIKSAAEKVGIIVKDAEKLFLSDTNYNVSIPNVKQISLYKRWVKI